MTFWELYQDTVRVLTRVSSVGLDQNQAESEARILIETVFGLTRHEWILVRDCMVSDLSKSVRFEGQFGSGFGDRFEDRFTAEFLAHAMNRFHKLVNERVTGKPLAYVLQEGWFMGRPYYLESGVLIPRPETEGLVEHALSMIERLLASQPIEVILDVGAGSGCVGIELGLRTGLEVVAWDVSLTPARISAYNAARFGLEHYRVRHGDFFDDRVYWGDLLATKRGLLVSNPPYVVRRDIADLDASVRLFEPLLALDGGEDGLDFYRRFLTDPVLLSGPMVFEIGFDLEGPLRSFIECQGVFGHSVVKSTALKSAVFERDLAGHSRYLVVE